MKTLRKLWAVVALFAMMTNTVLPAVEVFANETDSSSTIQEANPASNEAPVDTVADLDTEQPVKETSESEAEIQSEVDQQENAKANDSPEAEPVVKNQRTVGTQADGIKVKTVKVIKNLVQYIRPDGNIVDYNISKLQMVKDGKNLDVFA